MEALLPAYGPVVSATAPTAVIRKPPEPSAPLLPRVAEGDEAAFGECVDRYKRLVYSVVRRAYSSPSDVDDACQDIFVSLWRSARSFDPSRSSEPTFVVMVARRRLVDHQRAVGTRAIPATPDDTRVSSSAVESYVDARAAMAALGTCNEAQQHVVILSALKGFTHEEIAKELAMPVGTVKSHYARGIERVKRALLGRQGDS